MGMQSSNDIGKNGGIGDRKKCEFLKYEISVFADECEELGNKSKNINKLWASLYEIAVQGRLTT